MKLPESRVSQVPNLDTFFDEHGDDPVQALANELAGTAPTARARAIITPREGEPETVADGPDDSVVELAENGVRAARKLKEDGEDAELTEDELLGLEAIILISGERPPIIIQDGKFFPPPAPWEILDQFRTEIETLLHSVGRIEVTGHPELPWVGTGFLVADDVIMTNRHVAVEFAERGQGNGWSFKPGMTARIDYVEELGAINPAEFALTGVIGIHDTFDLALLGVETQAPAGMSAPTPLTIASAPPGQPGRNVFVVGYPARDPRNDPEIMQRLFGNVYNVKRLQPGLMVRIVDQEGIFHHDCTTLGGNSGSCVVDLETNQVVGLHFSGRYRDRNNAVALWRLANDPLLTAAGVNFG